MEASRSVTWQQVQTQASGSHRTNRNRTALSISPRAGLLFTVLERKNYFCFASGTKGRAIVVTPGFIAMRACIWVPVGTDIDTTYDVQKQIIIKRLYLLVFPSAPPSVLFPNPVKIKNFCWHSTIVCQIAQAGHSTRQNQCAHRSSLALLT